MNYLLAQRLRESLINRCFQRAQAIDDGVENGRIADEHAAADHALEVIAQRGQRGRAWNQFELPDQACVVVGVARAVEDLLICLTTSASRARSATAACPWT